MPAINAYYERIPKKCEDILKSLLDKKDCLPNLEKLNSKELQNISILNTESILPSQKYFEKKICFRTTTSIGILYSYWRDSLLKISVEEFSNLGC